MENTKINDIYAREILDSRSNPTVEVDVVLEDGSIGRADVPSGASTGEFEAVELRDKDENRYVGNGVLKAVENVNHYIKAHLIGMNAAYQDDIDAALCKIDGSKNKGNIGANAILGVSLACADAVSKSLKLPLYSYIGQLSNNDATLLPVPMMNILNGGKHANNNLDVQEFMILPHSADTFKDALRMGSEIYHKLRGILIEKMMSVSVGDEGGFAPDVDSAEEAIMLIMKAIENAGYKPGDDVYIALDMASSELYDKKLDSYFYEIKERKYGEMIAYYEKLTSKYPIISIEDGISEDDFESWKFLSDRLNNSVQLVGDDLFVTNKERLKKGIDMGVANSILIKLNQIGTLSETLDTMNLARKNNYTTVVSHRSGETEDTFIADLAVGFNAGQIKTGAPCRSERVAKYNRLLRIEEELKDKARYIGKDVFTNIRLK